MYKMRLGWYAGVSTALAGSVVISAFQQRPNFYSAMVYLAQSNFCLLVLVNFILFIYSSFLYSLTRLCFGRLRGVEVEQLTERAWFAITETCLAMTIFREEIGAWFLVMFTALVSGKIWGWIGDGRVEILEQQPPANPRLFHLRLSVSLAVSFIYDVWLLRYTINTVIQQARPNMMVMFLFEFAVLATCSWRTGIRYLLSVAEQNIIKTQTKKRLIERRREVREQREAMIRQRELDAAAGTETPADQEPLPNEDDVDEMDIEVPGWAAKGEWVLWLDLLTDMIKLGIYIAFFFMLLMFYGLPIHIIRDLFMTTRDFLKRLNALLRYRRAIKEMNRYPDATEEELAQENTCIICREEMRPWNPENNDSVDRIRPKKLPCGHTLHLGCLKSWLERQQVCPTCRRPVTTTDRPRPAGNHRVGLRIQVGGARQAEQQQQVAANIADAVARDRQNQQQQGNAQPPPDQQQNQQVPGNRPRVFNLGPLRVGFGANGAQIRELAEQFGMPQQGVNLVAQPAALAAAPTHTPLSGDHLVTANTLLLQAEAALQREVQSLEHRQLTLQTSQLLLAELQNMRLRQHRMEQANVTPTQGIGNPVQQPVHQTSYAHSFAGLPARVHSPILGRHGTSSYTTEIPAGSPDLPEGVVIPPGWTLMPLQRLNGQVQRQPSPQPGPGPSNDSLQPVTAPANGDTEPTPTVPDTNTRIPRPTQQNGSVRAVSPSPLRSSRAVSPAPTQNNQATAPTVVSPSPVAPNWGGSAQLFGNRSQSTAPQTEESSSSDNDSTPEGSSGKGKARAVTVEEASDDEQD